MPIRSILVPSTSVEDSGPRLSTALKLSRRLGAHIRELFIRPDPEAVYRNLPDVIVATGVTARQIGNEGREQAERSKVAFGRFCSENGIRNGGPIETLDDIFGTWVERMGELEPTLALAGRVHDLILVDRPDPEDFDKERMFDAAVFSTGRPCLVSTGNVSDDPLRHVVIAWNGSLEGARLIGHAVPLLHAADRVSIATVASERTAETAAADLQDYLMWHGIRARQLATPAHAGSVGAALLEAATRTEATMLVMGAYTHTRIREFLLGGVTRHVLKHSAVPVLMEH